MRLLNVETMKLEEYFGSRIPGYAILSHCWGEEEVTFTDINGPDWREKRGAKKIEYGTFQCQNDIISYIWIDTCCIDKSSSAELSEAINSMYQWYEKSDVCYAYLEDVKEDFDNAYENPNEDTNNNSIDSDYRSIDSDYGSIDANDGSIDSDNDSIEGNNDPIDGNNDSIKSLNGNVEKNIRKSRWFTRGWTLQELIAPSRIIFFSKNWLLLGEKDANNLHPERSLLNLLSIITTIPEAVLADPSQRTSCSVAKKMSWAAGRKATREEDMAYSLLGIFEVNMPLLYGEGTKAFRRLQEEIIKETDDQSLFAWGFPFDELDSDPDILAPSPAAFAMSAKVVPFPSTPNQQPYTMTNKGLRIDLRLLENGEIYSRVALLDCHYEDDFSRVIGIALNRTSNTSVFTRFSVEFPRTWSTKETEEAKVRTIYVRARRKDKLQDIRCLIRCHSLQNLVYKVLKVLPSSSRWNRKTGVVFVALEYDNVGEIHGTTLIVEFYSKQFENHFAVVLSLLDESHLYLDGERHLRKAVKIISQLEGDPSHELLKDEPEKEWRTEGTWKCKDAQLVNVSPHPQRTETMKITAVASDKEILNQSVLVLDVDCKWVILPINNETADSSSAESSSAESSGVQSSMT